MKDYAKPIKEELGTDDIGVYEENKVLCVIGLFIVGCSLGAMIALGI